MMIADNSDDLDQPDLSSNKLMAMGPDGTVYEVLISPAELAALGDEMERLGKTGASDFTPAPSVEKGWSNGVDSRNRTSTPNPVSPASRIGRLSAGCTGTLFGGRLVLTAFHCLWDGNGNWRSSTFLAGQDATSKPYGDVSHVWKYWSQGFVDNMCHYVYSSICVRYDWAILVLDHAPTSPTGWTPGYLGYTQNSNNSTVAGWNKYHNGYPGCSAPGAPVGCVENTMWGQTGSCANGDFFNGNGDGWDLDFYHGCDMSPGHSGGALYSWTPGSNGPYMIGITVADVCEGIACKTHSRSAAPNIALRLHPAVTNVMSYARSVY